MRTIIDACVLAPLVSRTVVLAVADAGLIQPFVSLRIIDEAIGATARIAPDGPASANDLRTLVGARPEWTVRSDIDHGANLRDKDDNHVLNAAVEGRAEIILTENIRDFPTKALAPFEVQARRPDAVLIKLATAHPDAMGAALTRAEAMLPARARASGLSFSDLLIRSRMKKLAHWWGGA